MPDKKDFLNHCKVSGILEGSLMTDPKSLELAIHMKKLFYGVFAQIKCLQIQKIF